jgi:(2Fe-2S) ferredoxin
MGGAYRCTQHPSLAVKADRRSWYWHSKGVGGFGSIDFMMKIENVSFRDAVESVTGISPAAREPEKEIKPHGSLILPDKAGLPLRLYDYLCVKRGVSRHVVDALIQEGKIYEDKRGNVVFVAYDERNKPRFACVRGTHGDYRGDCPRSDKRYGFNTAADAPSERLYVFESAIDLMSHATLAIMEYGDTTAWEYDRRLSLAGTSNTALSFFLNQHSTVKELVFCCDNDPAGRIATLMMGREYALKGYATINEPPQGKDYNEDLLALLMDNKRQNRAKSLSRDMEL